MDEWTQRIRASSIKGANDELQKIADNLSQDDSLPAAQREMVRRIRAVAAHACARIYGVDPLLVLPTTLANAEGRFSQVHAQLSTFSSNRTVDHLNSANSQADALLSDIATLPRPKATKPEVADATTSFLNHVDELTSRADKILADLQSASSQHQAAMNEHAAATRAGIDATTSTAQAGLDTATQGLAELRTLIDSAKAEFGAEATAQKSRLDSFITTGQATFNDQKDKALAEFQAAGVDALLSRDEDWDTKSAEWQTSFDEVKGRLEASDAFFKEREAAANRILGTTAASATAGTYKEEAEYQRREANFWRWAGLIAWVIALIVAVVSARDINSSLDDLDGNRLVAATSARLAVAGVALSIAVWINSQSRHHRDREREARTMASELTTLRPFIAELPESDQQSALKQAFGKYFPGKNGQSIHAPPD